MTVEPLSIDELRRAAATIADHALRTPVLTSPELNELLGARVVAKAESAQRAGAFKFRGAYNALSRLSDTERARGVLTYSSGNHAQAIALAGRILGIPTTIIMPSDAPEVKKTATRGYLGAGGEVIEYDRATTTREALGAEIAREREMTVVPPYDHPDVIAGQGTAAKELFDEVGELDALFVCCGGGGLLSGSSIAARALSPSCEVVGVEPEAGDDATRSFESRRPRPRTSRTRRVIASPRTPGWWRACASSWPRSSRARCARTWKHWRRAWRPWRARAGGGFRALCTTR